MPKQPDDDDVMISPDLMQDLRGDDASHLIVDLFAMHGRAAFRGCVDDLCHLAMWTGRGAHQRFDRALGVLQARGYIEQLADDQCRIVTRLILTGAEYRTEHPGQAEPAQ